MLSLRLGTRTALRGLVCALTLVPSVAVPLMERGALNGGSAMESHHDPARCPHGHDHRICTQVTSNVSVAAATQEHPQPQVLLAAAPRIIDRPTVARTFLGGPRSRAPPLA